MKTREEVARFMEHQLTVNYDCPLPKGICVHYGRQELRELLDFIYGGPPASEDEKLHREKVTYADPR